MSGLTTEDSNFLLDFQSSLPEEKTEESVELWMNETGFSAEDCLDAAYLCAVKGDFTGLVSALEIMHEFDEYPEAYEPTLKHDETLLMGVIRSNAAPALAKKMIKYLIEEQGCVPIYKDEDTDDIFDAWSLAMELGKIDLAIFMLKVDYEMGAKEGLNYLESLESSNSVLQEELTNQCEEIYAKRVPPKKRIRLDDPEPPTATTRGQARSAASEQSHTI